MLGCVLYSFKSLSRFESSLSFHIPFVFVVLLIDPLIFQELMHVDCNVRIVKVKPKPSGLVNAIHCGNFICETGSNTRLIFFNCLLF